MTDDIIYDKPELEVWRPNYCKLSTSEWRRCKLCKNSEPFVSSTGVTSNRKKVVRYAFNCVVVGYCVKRVHCEGCCDLFARREAVIVLEPEDFAMSKRVASEILVIDGQYARMHDVVYIADVAVTIEDLGDFSETVTYLSTLDAKEWKMSYSIASKIIRRYPYQIEKDL
jgi:hypothetical protein